MSERTVCTLYDKQTGQILQTLGGGTSSVLVDIPDGAGVLEGAVDSSEHYVDISDGDKVVPKKENPAYFENGVLYEVPQDTKAIIDSMLYQIAGTVELDFTPGVYRVRLKGTVQYKPKELTVEIDA